MGQSRLLTVGRSLPVYQQKYSVSAGMFQKAVAERWRRQRKDGIVGVGRVRPRAAPNWRDHPSLQELDQTRTGSSIAPQIAIEHRIPLDLVQAPVEWLVGNRADGG
jgi:hypothetical protein